VRYELIKKGLSEEVLEETLSRYPLDKEEQRAVEVARKKVESLKVKVEPGVVRKIQGYLLRKGFSPEICARALENISIVDHSHSLE
ncbi:MAG: RecX family transcriptional regulator, partial [Actinomycetota bacterium]|nr:RecX family transcriptional regulator [Actinomycetota bacterium]